MPRVLARKRRNWITATEAGRILGVTPRTAREVGARHGVAFKLGGCWRFSPQAVRDLAAGRLEPQPDSG